MLTKVKILKNQSTFLLYTFLYILIFFTQSALFTAYSDLFYHGPGLSLKNKFEIL